MARETRVRRRSARGKTAKQTPTFGQRAMGALEAFGEGLNRVVLYPETAAVRAAQESRPVLPAIKAGFKGEDREAWGGVLRNVGVENKPLEMGLNILATPDILVNPFGKTAKGIQLAKAAKLSKGLGAQAKAGERALLTFHVPGHGPVPLTPKFINEPVLGALGKVGGAIKGSKLGKEFRRAFSDTTGIPKMDEYKRRMDNIVRESVVNQTDARIKMDKMVDEIAKKRGWTFEQTQGQMRKLLDYIEAEQSSASQAWKTSRERKALLKLQARLPKVEEKAKASFEAVQKSGYPSTVYKSKYAAKEAKQKLTQAEYKLYQGKKKFAGIAAKGKLSVSRASKEAVKNIREARNEAWESTIHGGVKPGTKLYVDLDAIARRSSRRQAVRLLKDLKEAGYRTTTKRGEGLTPQEYVRAFDLEHVRANPHLPYPQYLKRMAEDAKFTSADAEYDDMLEMARENPYHRKSEYMLNANVAKAEEHEDLLRFLEGGEGGWMKYGFKVEPDVTERARIGSLLKKEDELKVALTKETDPAKAEALSLELKNLQAEKRSVGEAATIRASDDTRKQITEQFNVLKGQHDELETQLAKMYKEGVNRDEIHALQNQLADLKIKMADVDTQSDVFRAAQALNRLEADISKMRFEASKASRLYEDALSTAQVEKGQTFAESVAETKKRYGLLKKDLEKTRGTIARLEANARSGKGVDYGYLNVMRGQAEHLQTEINRIVGGGVGKYIKESEKIDNLVGRIKAKSEKYDEAVNAFRAEAKKGMDEEIEGIAKEIQADMARIAKEGTERQWFEAIEGYMYHYKAEELSEWLKGIPKERSLKALSLWDRTRMHRIFQGKTINEWNNIARSGEIGKYMPELDGFVGRMFDDDAAVLLALRRHAHERLKATDDFWKATRDNLGINSAEFEAAKKKGTIDAGLYEGVKHEAFKDAKNPSGVVWFEKETAKAIADMRKVLEMPENVSQFETLLQRVNSIYKAYTLSLYPAYHARNVVGNVLNNLLGGVWRVSAYAKALAFQLGKDVKIAMKNPISVENQAITELDKALLSRLIKTHGIADTGFYATEGMKRTGIEREVKGLGAKLAGDNPLVKGGQKVGQAFENNAKVAHFIHKLEDGFTPEAAAASVRKYTFDYSDIGWAGRKARLVMPFISWTMKNVPLQMEALLTRPGLMAGYERARMTGLGKDKEKPDEAYMSQFMIENFPMYVGKNKDGNYMYFLGGSWIPAGDVGRVLGSGRNLKEIISDTPAEFMKEIFMLVNPLYTAPARMAFNYDPYFEGKVQNFPGQVRKLNVGPGVSAELPAKVVYGLRQFRPISEVHNLFAPDKPMKANALRSLTGLKTSVYDPKRGRVQKVIDTRKELAELKGWLKYYRRKGDEKNVKAIQGRIDELLGAKALRSK